MHCEPGCTQKAAAPHKLSAFIFLAKLVIVFFEKLDGVYQRLRKMSRVLPLPGRRAYCGASAESCWSDTARCRDG